MPHKELLLKLYPAEEDIVASLQWMISMGFTGVKSTQSDEPGRGQMFGSLLHDSGSLAIGGGLRMFLEKARHLQEEIADIKTKARTTPLKNLWNTKYAKDIKVW